jgi:hypothetical protein
LDWCMGFKDAVTVTGFNSNSVSCALPVENNTHKLPEIKNLLKCICEIWSRKYKRVKTNSAF